jgi:2,4-dienoyl-CoA reductase-like NADH-dependent reductase (Old Yellow Enzyme family)
LVPLAKRFKEEVDTPIIAVGGFRSIEVISAVLEKRSADFISMCRPFIREPHLMKRWQSGDTSRATCVSCNGCFEIGLEGDGVACKIDKAKAKKAEG